MTVQTSARLSLCMIVKDEADMLPGFLERVRGLWDELVVVDTGSTDHSVALLEAAGARVLHQPWRHDFALARNELQSAWQSLKKMYENESGEDTGSEVEETFDNFSLSIFYLYWIMRKLSK